MKVDVHLIHFDADQKLVSFINEKVNNLEHFSENIVSSEVFLRIDKSSSNDNKIAEIKLMVPGKELFAKKRCKSFEEATDSACEAIRKQIRKHKAKVRQN